MRTAYTEKLYIGSLDRHIATKLLNKSSEFHDGSLQILYHDRESCYSITSARGGYRAVQRAKAKMWEYVLKERERHHRGGWSDGYSSEEA